VRPSCGNLESRILSHQTLPPALRPSRASRRPARWPIPRRAASPRPGAPCRAATTAPAAAPPSAPKRGPGPRRPIAHPSTRAPAQFDPRVRCGRRGGRTSRRLAERRVVKRSRRRRRRGRARRRLSLSACSPRGSQVAPSTSGNRRCASAVSTTGSPSACRSSRRLWLWLKYPFGWSVRRGPFVEVRRGITWRHARSRLGAAWDPVGLYSPGAAIRGPCCVLRGSGCGFCPFLCP